jgi:hypothetical protein
MKMVSLASLLFVALCAPALACGPGGGPGCGSGGGDYRGVPGPIAGAGLPVIAAGYGVYWLIRRRRTPRR